MMKWILASTLGIFCLFGWQLWFNELWDQTLPTAGITSSEYQVLRIPNLSPNPTHHSGCDSYTATAAGANNADNPCFWWSASTTTCSNTPTTGYCWNVQLPDPDEYVAMTSVWPFIGIVNGYIQIFSFYMMSGGDSS